MTIKLYVRVEPVTETAQLSVTRRREDEQEPFYSRFDVLTGIESPAIELEVGDKLEITAEPMRAIVLDREQNVVRLEDPNTGALKEERERKKKEKKEAEEEHKRDQEARAKEASRLKKEYGEEASKEKVPPKQVPFPAPLPEEYEKEKEKREGEKVSERPFGSEGAHPPKGGAKDSKEVKGK